jgi:hypothetical protein
MCKHPIPVLVQAGITSASSGRDPLAEADPRTVTDPAGAERDRIMTAHTSPSSPVPNVRLPEI